MDTLRQIKPVMETLMMVIMETTVMIMGTVCVCLCVCLSVCVCACACVRARVRACVHARARARVRARVCGRRHFVSAPASRILIALDL